MEGPSGKLYAGRSLWGMLPAQEPRRSAVRLAELLVERPRLSEDAPWPRRLPAAAAPAPPHPREQPRRPESVRPWPWPWPAFFAWAGQTPAWAGAWKAPSALWTPQVELQWFDAIILLTIGANCATMAWESPLDEMLHPEGTWKSDFVCQHVESGPLGAGSRHSLRSQWWLWGGALQSGGAATPRREAGARTPALAEVAGPDYCLFRRAGRLVREGLPGHLHRRAPDQGARLRLPLAPRGVPARRVVPARLCGRHARVGTHPLPLYGQLFRHPLLPCAPAAPCAQADARHAQAGGIRVLEAPARSQLASVVPGGAGLLWVLGGTRLWAGAHGPHRAHRREGRPQCGCEPGPISPTWRDP